MRPTTPRPSSFRRERMVKDARPDSHARFRPPICCRRRCARRPFTRRVDHFGCATNSGAGSPSLLPSLRRGGRANAHRLRLPQRRDVRAGRSRGDPAGRLCRWGRVALARGAVRSSHGSDRARRTEPAASLGSASRVVSWNMGRAMDSYADVHERVALPRVAAGGHHTRPGGHPAGLDPGAFPGARCTDPGSLDDRSDRARGPVHAPCDADSRARGFLLVCLHGGGRVPDCIDLLVGSVHATAGPAFRRSWSDSMAMPSGARRSTCPG